MLAIANALVSGEFDAIGDDDDAGGGGDDDDDEADSVDNEQG